MERRTIDDLALAVSLLGQGLALIEAAVEADSENEDLQDIALRVEVAMKDLEAIRPR